MFGKKADKALSLIYLYLLGVALVPAMNLGNTAAFIASILDAKLEMAANPIRLLYGVQLSFIGLLTGLTIVIAARAASGKGDIRKPLASYFMSAFIAAFSYTLLAVWEPVTSCSFLEVKLFAIRVLLSGIIWLPLFSKQQVIRSA